MHEMDGYQEVIIDGNRVFLPPPVQIPDEPFVGMEDLIEKTLAAWSTINGTLAQHFRLYGPPGIGKNTLIYELARLLGKELYIIKGNADLSVEDLTCVPKIDENNTMKIYYVASPLFAALYRGGIAFFDEIGKAPHDSLTALASVLDGQETLTSTSALITIKAKPGFLFCAALNEDEETGIGLPENIQDRTYPAFYVGYPSMEQLDKIIQSQLGRDSDIWIENFVLLFKTNNLSPRAAIKLISYAIKLYKYGEVSNTSSKLSQKEVQKYLMKAAEGFPVEIDQLKLSPKCNKFKPKEKRSQNVHTMLPENNRDSIH